MALNPRKPDLDGRGVEEADAADLEARGIRPARNGLQPVRDLASFLSALPRFDPKEAERLRAVIAEQRAERRAAERERDC
jgi:hypothetical protein